jgi:hypothetical protein
MSVALGYIHIAVPCEGILVRLGWQWAGVDAGRTSYGTREEIHQNLTRLNRSNLLQDETPQPQSAEYQYCGGWNAMSLII